MPEIDTFNKFLVGAQGENIAVVSLGRTMSKPDALILAAWLVALADDKGEFPAILAAVSSS